MKQEFDIIELLNKSLKLAEVSSNKLLFEESILTVKDELKIKKINKQLAEQLEILIEHYNGDKNSLLKIHNNAWSNSYSEINKLNNIELAELLINGYEVLNFSDEDLPNEFEFKNYATFAKTKYKSFKINDEEYLISWIYDNEIHQDVIKISSITEHLNKGLWEIV